MPWQKEMHHMHLVMTFFRLLISHVFDEFRKKKLTHTYSGTFARVKKSSLKKEAEQYNCTGTYSVNYLTHQIP